MKKLLYAIPVLCAIVLTGCPSEKKNPDDPTSGITAITVKPEKVTLAEGADITLTVIPTPKAAKGEYTWVSSDTTIATVDSEGKVIAITPGTAIVTVTEKGGAKATSEIHVTSYLESFSFGQVFLYNVEDTTGMPIVDRELKNGDVVHYYRLPIDFWAFSDGCYINADGDFVGSEEALLITMPAYVMYAPATMNKADYVGLYCLGEWEIIKDSSEYYTLTGEPGVYEPAVLTNVLAAMDAYNQQNYTDFSAYIRAAREAVSGTYLESLVYDCDSTGTQCGYYNGSYITDAVLESAYFYIGGNQGSSKYMYMIDYCNFSFRSPKHNGEDFWWGISATHDDENDLFSINDRSKFYVTDLINMEFGELPAEEVSRHDEWVKLGDELITLPENVRANIDRQIKEGKIRTINALVRK